MIHVQALNVPAIDLSLFAGLSKEIQRVDSLRIPAVEKFKHLTAGIIGEGDSHLYLVVYMRLPSLVFPFLMELQGFRAFTMTVETTGMNTDCLLSGSLENWYLFGQKDHSNPMVLEVQSKVRKILNGINSHYRLNSGEYNLSGYLVV